MPKPSQSEPPGNAWGHALNPTHMGTPLHGPI